jgi:hypothetical protein
MTRPTSSPLHSFALALLFIGSGLPFRQAQGQTTPSSNSGVVDKGSLHFEYNERGIYGLASKDDPFKATVTPSLPSAPTSDVGVRGGGRRGGGGGGGGGQPISLNIRYRIGEGTNWTVLNAGQYALTADAAAGTLKYSLTNTSSPLKVTQNFKTDGKTLDWTIDLEAATNGVTIGDFSMDVPSNGPRGGGEDPKQIFEKGFIKHQFISGGGSFMYWVRASGDGPFLIVTVKPGTKLEYSGGGGRGGGGGDFVHSGYSGNNEKRGTWRQEHTFLKMGAPGTLAAKTQYGFRFQFAKSYDDMRDVLYHEGLFDIRTVPGMTIPTDLTAKFDLHTKARIDSVIAEFPGQTTVTPVTGGTPGHHIYEVTFKKLGENKLTINHDAGQKTYLEYFVTEPLETVIKKRASFIANRQQIRDPSKWWDGVYGPYDMKNKVVRTVDDPDIFLGRMIYSLTCDDPGLSKAPYLAEKNASFPDAKEIESLEYYLEHFVWGKLQRTDKENPYPYGVYGTPNWWVDRDPQRRKDWILGSAIAPQGTSAQILEAGSRITAPTPQQQTGTAWRDLSKEHVWRSYDYPHIVMMYFHMYEIAKKYPEMSRYSDAAGYLERAFQTAKAFYVYPYEIYPEYYESTKWGLYNELVVLKLADVLEREGQADRAAWLRAEWEKKVKYFVYDDKYPFRSEYAFDRTAFESTYALAKYGATHDMKADTNLWHDNKLDKWYSHPSVKREDSRAFMDRQLAAGLCVRGWLETSYYQLGADGGLSYMAAMGGWGVLDYAINFAPKPYDWLGLGYASYLSSWCLVNSGTPESQYGFFFPGKENDGAAGWQFMSGKVGNAWMGSSNPGGATVPRGPWHYDGEIDLGFCGALRMAATVVTRDPIFDWIAYGGDLKRSGATLNVTPKDGLRQRLVVLTGTAPKINRLKLELDRDGFADGQAIAMDSELKKISFTMENRTKNAHTTGLWLSLPDGTNCEVTQDGKKVELKKTGVWDYPLMTELKTGTGSSKIEITKK